jgi:hypothetical protein
MMRKILTSLLLLLGVGAMATKMTSPNGKLSVVVEGQLLKVSYQQRQVLEIIESRLGTSVEALGGVKDDYRMLTGKRSHCQNAANEYRCGSVQLRVYNDGIALRTLSVSPQSSDVIYRIPEGTRRWMQQWCDSYEGFFPLSTTYKVAPVPSYSGISKSAEGWNNRWAYPALLEPVDGTFVLISEANIQH